MERFRLLAVSIVAIAAIAFFSCYYFENAPAHWKPPELTVQHLLNNAEYFDGNYVVIVIISQNARFAGGRTYAEFSDETEAKGTAIFPAIDEKIGGSKLVSIAGIWNGGEMELAVSKYHVHELYPYVPFLTSFVALLWLIFFFLKEWKFNFGEMIFERKENA